MSTGSLEGVMCSMLGVWCVACWGWGVVYSMLGCDVHHVGGVVCSMLGVWCVACWGCGLHHVGV